MAKARNKHGINIKNAASNLSTRTQTKNYVRPTRVSRKIR